MKSVMNCVDFFLYIGTVEDFFEVLINFRISMDFRKF
jgi:hypothetical protein